VSGHIVGVGNASIVLLAYWTVLLAELLGDKSIYTVASLGMRFPMAAVFGGMVAAFGAKMMVAVWLGHALSALPPRLMNLVSAAAFFLSALVIWIQRPELVVEESPSSSRSFRAAAVCFLSLFFTEWGDPGQIAAAALSMRTQSPWAPWLGGTFALVTKGTLALTLGYGLRDRLPRGTLRRFAAATCCVLGLSAVIEAWPH
jgi:putative Ca2+/H+ antiporter (TMEM165/GDT1 family)